jgi:hypothetical protein
MPYPSPQNATVRQSLCGQGQYQPYEPLEPLAKRTKEGYASGKAAFATFAKIQGPDQKLLEEITLADLTTDGGKKVVEAFTKFGSFLLDHKSGDKHYKPDTQTGYLGHAKNFLGKKFRDVARHSYRAA